jgi:hypothetical protein
MERECTNSIGFNALRDIRWEGVKSSDGTMQKSTPAETLFPEVRQFETHDASAAYDLVVFDTAGGVTGVDY